MLQGFNTIVHPVQRGGHLAGQHGWIRQHPELLKNVRPIDDLIAPEEIEFAARLEKKMPPHPSKPRGTYTS
nr:hypothetical protein [Rhizobium leguminosarum]